MSFFVPSLQVLIAYTHTYMLTYTLLFDNGILFDSPLCILLVCNIWMFSVVGWLVGSGAMSREGGVGDTRASRTRPSGLSTVTLTAT